MLRGRHAAATPRTRPVMRPGQRDSGLDGARPPRQQPPMTAISEHSTGRTPAERLPCARLCVITAAEDPPERVLATVRAACDAGAEVVQLRRKGEDARLTLGLAERCREITAVSGTLLVVNDRLDIATAAGAGG